MFFKNRNLNMAILVSFFWHFVFMLSFSPVLLSPQFKKNSTTISFLGSILEQAVTVQDKNFRLSGFSRSHKIERTGGDVSEKLILMPPEKMSREVSPRQDKEKIAFAENKGETPDIGSLNKDKKKSVLGFENINVSGSARNRKLLYKPEWEKVPVFSSYLNSDYSVRIRFKISKHGVVENPECVLSSGFSEIDERAIRYIRKWQYVSQDKGEDEGTVHIDFSRL
jgi:TonB family protein